MIFVIALSRYRWGLGYRRIAEDPGAGFMKHCTLLNLDFLISAYNVSRKVQLTGVKKPS